jgi:hypothetical protein
MGSTSWNGDVGLLADPRRDVDGHEVGKPGDAEGEKRCEERAVVQREDGEDDEDCPERHPGQPARDLVPLREARGDGPGHTYEPVVGSGGLRGVRMVEPRLVSDRRSGRVAEKGDRGRALLARGGDEPARVEERKGEGDAVVAVLLRVHGSRDDAPLGLCAEPLGIALHDGALRGDGDREEPGGSGCDARRLGVRRNEVDRRGGLGLLERGQPQRREDGGGQPGDDDEPAKPDDEEGVRPEHEG